MSKAEDLAKKYCEGSSFEDACMEKPAYIAGYHQAEKDLTDKAKTSSGWDGFFYGQGYKQAEKDNELTWQDMFDIFRLVNEVLDDYAEGKTKKEVGEEVLKRFKNLKHVK